MRRSTERILTTHTGSLPRPQDLESMVVGQAAGGPADPAALEALVRSAVAEIVRKQISAGVDVVNDGEAGRSSYTGNVADRLSGFGGEPLEGREELLAGLFTADFPEYSDRIMAVAGPAWRVFEMPSCDGPVSYSGQKAVQEDIKNLKSALEGVKVEDCFMTAPSPGIVASFPNKYYPKPEAYLEAIANAMREEYEAIYHAGIGLQIDSQDLSYAGGFSGAQMSLEEMRKDIGLRVEALNHAVANIPPEAMRIHVCYGNHQVPHTQDSALRDYIDVVLNAKPAGLSLEMANPRHAHEWKIFEDVKLPEGKYLIPGVIDVKTNIIEHPELVAERIIRLARLVGRENVLAGTDCGFATIANLHWVLPGIAWAKLEVMSEGARLASKELW